MIISQLISILSDLPDDTIIVAGVPLEYDEYGDVENYIDDSILKLTDASPAQGLLYLDFEERANLADILHDKNQLRINFPKISRQKLYWRSQIQKGRI